MATAIKCVHAKDINGSYDGLTSVFTLYEDNTILVELATGGEVLHTPGGYGYGLCLDMINGAGLVFIEEGHDSVKGVVLSDEEFQTMKKNRQQMIQVIEVSVED